jgi:hypothetical protein
MRIKWQKGLWKKSGVENVNVFAFLFLAAPNVAVLGLGKSRIGPKIRGFINTWRLVSCIMEEAGTM